MTYALAWPLQEALFAALSGDPGVAVHFGQRIYDAPPPAADAAAEGPYAVIGEEIAQDWSTAGDQGAVHLVTLSVFAPDHGYARAKQGAAALSDRVLSGDLSLTRGTLISARFVDARTKRAENGALRQIDLRFRLTLEDTLEDTL